MNDLLNFSLKTAKTLVFLPFIIISSLFHSLNQKPTVLHSEKLKKRNENENEDEEESTYVDFSFLKSYLKFLTPSYYMNLTGKIILFFIMKLINIVVVVGAFSATSLIITLFAYYIMCLPSIIENPVSLSFANGSNSQSASLYFNCSKLRDNCSHIDAINYEVLFEFEVLKNEKSLDSSNFEIQLNYHLNDEQYSAKKINFIEVNDYYIEKFYKLIYFPLNLIGYKKTELIVMNMIKNLDNTKLGLDFMDVSINNNKLNIRNSKVVFIPIVGYFRNLIWSLRVFTLPTVFSGFVFLQVFVYVFIKFIFLLCNQLLG
jgi:hypothetical protein